MGNTFRLWREVDAVESEFGNGGAPALCRPHFAARPRVALRAREPALLKPSSSDAPGASCAAASIASLRIYRYSSLRKKVALGRAAQASDRVFNLALAIVLAKRARNERTTVQCLKQLKILPRVVLHQIWPASNQADAATTSYPAETMVLTQRMLGEIAQYVINMGADIELFRPITRIPHWENLRPLSREELRRLQLDTADGEALPFVSPRP